jgi:hypothetical protein
MAASATDHKKIDKDRLAYMSDPALVAKYRKYVDGQTDYTMTAKQKELLEGVTSNEFSDNICFDIVSLNADRIEFRNWTCQNEAVTKQLDDLYRIGGIADLQNVTHEDALTAGNACVSLWPDLERKTIDFFEEPWWDGEQGIFIQYDERKRPLYAVKEWAEEIDGVTKRRRLVWYDDRFERWVSDVGGATWEPIMIEDDTDWPMPWIDKKGKPLRIPYVHFPNSGRVKRIYGKSELWGGLLAVQDQMNDIGVSLVICTRMTAAQIYTATGISQTAAQAMKVGHGELWWSEEGESQFGAIPAGNADTMLNVYENKAGIAGRMTRTPRHSISGTWPSGEAIMRAETPLVGKARRQITRFAKSWIYLAHKALTYSNNFFGTNYDTDPKTALIDVVFADPERRDPVTNSTIANNLSDRISDEEALRIMEYREDRIAKVVAEAEAQKERDTARAIKTAQATKPVLPAGGGGGGGGRGGGNPSGKNG